MFAHRTADGPGPRWLLFAGATACIACAGCAGSGPAFPPNIPHYTVDEAASEVDATKLGGSAQTIRSGLSQSLNAWSGDGDKRARFRVEVDNWFNGVWGVFDAVVVPLTLGLSIVAGVPLGTDTCHVDVTFQVAGGPQVHAEEEATYAVGLYYGVRRQHCIDVATKRAIVKAVDTAEDVGAVPTRRSAVAQTARNSP